MTANPTPPADPSLAERKREARAEFMRAHVLAAVRAGREYRHKDLAITVLAGPTWQCLAVEEARELWDAIEAEAGKP